LDNNNGGGMKIDRIKEAARKSHLIRALLYPAIVSRRCIFDWRASIQDDILDNVCEILADDPVIHVSEFHGKFVMDSKSGLFRGIAKSKDYEPDLAKCCLRYLDRDRDAVDIGANIGFYTVLFAKELRDKRVLAVEPTPNALSRLYKNIVLNNVRDSVIVFEGVVSNHSGVAEIHTIPGKEEYSSLGVMEHPSIFKEAFETIRVESTTLDHLIDAQSLDPGFIKIDVEGMEHLVLDGMQRVLRDKRPVILLELIDPLLRKNGSSAEEVIKFIEEHGYDVIDPRFERVKPGQRKVGDILCLPTNKGVA
jgi:FkbM family methyltransferase